ncbi:MAG TPA: hypothetical protein VK453_05385 [Micromonosporaceae bacterium]|nr:hypothetical protein [Micromonosporaceae bacterium]
MDGALPAAVAHLREVFARYPRRAVLDGCPHCRGSVSVADHDLYSLTISLGNTVGDTADVKSLLPMLLERLVSSTELDANIVLGKLPREQWRTWPDVEQRAVEAYLDAVWRSLLAAYPSQVGSFTDPTDFLDAVAVAGQSIDRYLDVWDLADGSAADRHLAETVTGGKGGASEHRSLDRWLQRESVRARLERALERDLDRPWAGDLALAHDFLRT